MSRLRLATCGLSQMLSVIVAVSLGEASSVQAATVRHILLPNDSVFSAETQHACGTYLLQPSPHWCNPALFPFTGDAPIKADIALSADQDAYNTVTKLINAPVTADFVDHLFKDKDFQSFSGLGRFEAISQYLAFSYTPAYLVGAVQISNPNLPEVSAAAVRESQMRLTSGLLAASAYGWKLYAGGSAYFYDQKLYYIHANALDLTARDPKSLVATSTHRGVDADLGLMLKPDGAFLPSFSLTADHIFLPEARPVGQSHTLDLEPLLRRMVRLEAGYTILHASGSYYLGAQLPFWDLLRQLDPEGASVAFIYGIGRLRAFTSYSPLMNAFGFMFMSANYHVGIEYSNAKQDNTLEIGRQNNVQLFVSASL